MTDGLIGETGFNIREARSGDEAELANTHLNSWRESYGGLLPQDYLASLPLTFKRRVDSWRSKIIDREQYVIPVAETPDGITGFACLSAGRDESMQSFAEVQAIYLLEKYKRKGTGFALLSFGFAEMVKRGFTTGYCWVLEGNPTRSFYERSSGKLMEATKFAEIGGVRVKEVAYRWDDLTIGRGRRV